MIPVPLKIKNTAFVPVLSALFSAFCSLAPNYFMPMFPQTLGRGSGLTKFPGMFFGSEIKVPVGVHNMTDFFFLLFYSLIILRYGAVPVIAEET